MADTPTLRHADIPVFGVRRKIPRMCHALQEVVRARRQVILSQSIADLEACDHKPCCHRFHHPTKSVGAGDPVWTFAVDSETLGQGQASGRWRRE